ncbi:MAG: phosphotransferase [Gordonia sp. (in: high G+C Gram-positive bacteria)]|uniref:phosphotransferase family protein n=1 Tax=Gordonia sp. (in: high G+C Gram-positive bacteria) TaxID=84139 RepID=UPI0039E3BF4D
MPADLTPDWLGHVLGADVADVRVSPVGTGQTGATYRVEYARGDGEPAVPLIAKLPSQDPAVRERVALSYRAEHSFYANAADTVAVPLPRVHHCEVSEDCTEFVLLMEDLAPAVQGDQLDGCSPERARLAVEALAGLHGPRWCDPAWTEFPGVTMPKPDADFARGMGELARMATDITLGKIGDRLDDGQRATINAAADRVERWLGLEPDRFALLHGDYRLDNMLFPPDDSAITIVDWQTLTVGLPARDLAYFVGTSLVPEVRREHERDLVDRYHAALLGYGVRDYTADDCWRDYRLGMLQIPLITTLGYAFSAETERGDEMAATMLARGARAIDDHDTVALVEEVA